MKKFIILLLIATMIVSVGACSLLPGGDDVSDKTLVFGANSEPTGLCPIDVAFTGGNAAFQNLLYDSLVTWNNEKNEVEPGLAESWKYLDDYKIEFKLRKDAETQDGSKFTSSDVLYTFKKAKELGATASYWTSIDVANCYAPDDYTFVLVTTVTDPFIVTSLANIPYSILVEEAVDKNGGIEKEHFLPTAGTGPYKLVEWIPGSQIKFERKDNYWGDAPYYKFQEGRIITDANSRLLSFESGETNLSYNPSVSDIDTIKNNDKVQVGNYPVTALQMIFMNNTNTYLKDVNVRRAISLAVDRESILDVAGGGYGSLTDAFWSKLSKGYVEPKDGATNYFRYDMDEAKAILAQSTFPKGFTIKFQYTSTTPAYVTYSQMLKNSFAQLGINLELNPVDTATLTSNFTKGSYDAGTAQSANPDPSKQLNAIDSRLGWNVANPATGFEGGDAFNKLIDGAKFSLDEDVRKDYYAQLNEFIAINVPEIPVYSPNATVLADANLEGIRLNVMGSIITRYITEKE